MSHTQTQFQRLRESKKDEIIQVLENEVLSLTEQLQDYHSLRDKCQQLEYSFSNNLRVIEELEEENTLVKAKAIQLKEHLEEITEELEQLQAHVRNQPQQSEQERSRLTHRINQQEQETQVLEKQLMEIKNKNTQLVSQHGVELQQMETKHKLEIEKVSQLAAQSIAARESQSQRGYYSLKAETDKIIADVKGFNESLLNENKQLLSEISALKQENLTLCTQATEVRERLNRLLKEQQYNGEIAEKQMDNLKSAHDTFEATLKDKLHSLQGEKEKLLTEMVDLKNDSKTKRKQLKEEFNRRFEQLVNEKNLEAKKTQELLKELQVDNSKKEYVIHELRKDQLELEKLRKSKAKEGDDKNNFYARALEEDKRFFKNQLSLKEIKIEELHSSLRDLEKEVSDQNVIIGQLKTKTALQESRQKPKSDSEDKISIRESEWDFDKKVQQPSLEVIALHKQVDELKAQYDETRAALTLTTARAKEDCLFFKEKLDLKEKEVSLVKEEARLGGMTTQDKEQQINKLNDQISSQKLETKRMELNLKEQQFENSKLTETVTKLTDELRAKDQEIHNLYNEMDILNEQREALIQISNELRAEVDFSRQFEREHTVIEPLKRISISNISKISDEPRNIPMSPSVIEVPDLKTRGDTLVNLIKQKNRREKEESRMEVTAKQIPLHQPSRKMLPQETNSQKYMYERMKSRSKSPNDPEREDRRRRSVETESQRKIFQQIKRGNDKRRMEKESVTPRIGIDYNRLREEWDQEQHENQDQPTHN